MAARTVSWKPRSQNTILGTDVPRLDGVDKATGFARYSTDMVSPTTLTARLLTSPHAHAMINAIDVAPARSMPGVKAVYIFPQRAPQAGNRYEIHYEGTPIAAVAAETAAQASAAAAAIKVDYEVLPHHVNDQNLEMAEQADRLKPGRRDSVDGDPDAVIQEAQTDAQGTKYVLHKGRYGVAAITHCCLEPHGSTCEWNGGKLQVYLSTQNVSGTGGQFAGAPEIQVDAANVTVNCEHIGGGFGSKFAADEWGIACAVLARDAGQPVQLHLDRATELKIAGSRPSGFEDVTLVATRDGKLAAWDSHHWGTDGPGGGTVSPTTMPYVIQAKNRRVRATGIVTDCGPTRAWRAPNHPQACALTCTAIDDLAAKLEMDPYDVFLKNLDITSGNPLSNAPEVYAAEMAIAERLMGWKSKWKGRGQWEDGGWKRGLGMALHTWAGRAGKGECTLKVHQDGTVEAFSGTQDLGTGTRTAIAIVVAESFGLPLSAVSVNIGTSKFDPCGGSGGSTTIGGISGPYRRASLDALWQIFDKVAARYSVEADNLAAQGGQIVAGDRAVCSWQQACGLLGPMGLTVRGTGPADDGLTNQQVGGVQMVDVSVDPDTGRVRVNRYVAVQDMGTIINTFLAKSQILGAMIQCISYALMEERIMDDATGKFINANLRDYNLAKIGDIGELIVELYQPDSEYSRGVVGLGEPPVISGGAAIANAVANAVGVRVPTLPMTPKRILDALADA
jgi:xanthine dehydrogenase YagR molybdenum-binding subunit